MRSDFIIIDFTPLDWSGEDWREQWDRNLERLRAQDLRAKEDGRLMGRYITEPVADGHATYIIIRENKKSVRIRLATGLGDDYMIPYWGRESSIDKTYVEDCLEWRDRMDAFIEKRQAELASK